MNALAGARLRSLTKELLKFKIDRLFPNHISCRSCSFISCENAAAEKPNDMTELLSCVSTDKQIPDGKKFPPSVHRLCTRIFSHSKSNFTRFEGWRKLKCFNLCNLCILHRQSIAFASYANVRLMGWWIELLQLDSAKELFLHLTSWVREARKNLFGFHLARANRGNMMQNLWRNKTWSHKRASKREWISDFINFLSHSEILKPVKGFEIIKTCKSVRRNENNVILITRQLQHISRHYRCETRGNRLEVVSTRQTVDWRRHVLPVR